MLILLIILFISTMSSNGFNCTNGKQILNEWLCDNWDDCGDNSDETICGFRNGSCEELTEIITAFDFETALKKYKILIIGLNPNIDALGTTSSTISELNDDDRLRGKCAFSYFDSLGVENPWYLAMWEKMLTDGWRWRVGGAVVPIAFHCGLWVGGKSAILARKENAWRCSPNVAHRSMATQHAPPVGLDHPHIVRELRHLHATPDPEIIIPRPQTIKPLKTTKPPPQTTEPPKTTKSAPQTTEPPKATKPPLQTSKPPSQTTKPQPKVGAPGPQPVKRPPVPKPASLFSQIRWRFTIGNH